MKLKYLNKKCNKVIITSDKPIYGYSLDDGYIYVLATREIKKVDITFFMKKGSMKKESMKKESK